MNILHTLQREEPVGKMADDGCQTLLPPAPKIRIQKPRVDKQESNGSQDTTRTKRVTKAPETDTKDRGVNNPDMKAADDGKPKENTNGVGAAKRVDRSKDRTPEKKKADTKVRKT